jgi:hypothetical protein
MAIIIGTGDGARLDIYDYETGWNGPDDPDYSVLANSEQHGYIYHKDGQWVYHDEASKSKHKFKTLHKLFASVDPNASLDMPDNLFGWWQDELDHQTVV